MKKWALMSVPKSSNTINDLMDEGWEPFAINFYTSEVFLKKAEDVVDTRTMIDQEPALCGAAVIERTILNQLRANNLNLSYLVLGQLIIDDLASAGFDLVKRTGLRKPISGEE